MSVRSRPVRLPLPSLSFGLLGALLLVLLLAGGASRGDVAGQVIVRAVSALALVIAVLFGDRPRIEAARPVVLLLAACILLVLAQLIPLPPALWQALPHRAIFEHAVSGEQPWRPLSIAPGLTVNAAASLLVPLAVLVLTLGLRPDERKQLAALILCLAAASMFLAVLQFSGASLANPFVNSRESGVSGSFANRNHFALFLALGCVIVSVWPFLHSRRTRWRGLAALGILPLFLFAILASGSRAGLMVGGIALVFGLIISAQGIRRMLRFAPRWVFPSFIAAIVAIVVLSISLSAFADRAESIRRIIALDTGADLRTRSLSLVLELARNYLPMGAGFGGFDTAFRIDEPFEFLSPYYLNHAHNDFLEIVIDGGLPALALLLIALGWAVAASIRAWRGEAGAESNLSRLGSVILLLILIASSVDYPARTPMIMAMVVISAVWLSAHSGTAASSALPRQRQRL